MRVLVAEDNEDHLFLARIALNSAEDVTVEVIPARDGQEAIDYLRASAEGEAARPDLMLLDLSMPRLTGLQVLEQMQAHEQLASLPVVVLTSSSLPSDIQRAYELGANSYVTKTGDLGGLVDYWCHTAQLPLN